MNEVFPRLAATERALQGWGGPVVVFLHGLGCERAQFAPQLAGLDPRLRLLSLDLPGHWESPPLHVGRYGVTSVAEAISVDLTERGHQDIVLIGHSAGGLVALQIAVTRPDLVRGVTLLDTTPLEGDELRAEREDVHQLVRVERVRYYYRAEEPFLVVDQLMPQVVANHAHVKIMM